MGAEVLMVGALGWPTPTEDMGFWRPVLGELSMAGERDGAVSQKHLNTAVLTISKLAMLTILNDMLSLLLHQLQYINKVLIYKNILFW